jgi:GNAT superfamily N-acetyltransferase
MQKNRLMLANLLQIRRATLNDLDILTSFSCALCEETEGRRPNVSVVRAGVSKILESSDWFILVAEDLNGRIVGEVTMGGEEWSDWSNGLFWLVTSSYVDKKSRELGVSRLLYEKLREIANESPDKVIGIKGALKETNYSAQAALSLIGRNYNGYIVIEERFRAENALPVHERPRVAVNHG